MQWLRWLVSLSACKITGSWLRSRSVFTLLRVPIAASRSATRVVSARDALFAVTAADEQVESVAWLLETHGERDISEEAVQNAGAPLFGRPAIADTHDSSKFRKAETNVIRMHGTLQLFPS